MKAAKEQEKRHFVLVHGACHGAWSWYKIISRLKSAGHRVTAFDLTASGIKMKTIFEVQSFHDYSEPLLEFMASLSDPNEKVILVGHSLGGMNLALAMEKFPEKVAVAVFLTAFMPDTIHPPSYVIDQLFEGVPKEAWLDTEFLPYGSSNEPLTSMFFGPKFLSSNLYQLCPTEDLHLALMLARTGSVFREDLGKANKFSDEAYGSVKRVFVVCKEDKAIPEEYQRWMISNNNSGVEEVLEIEDADHMPMFSKPQELCNCLLAIANKHA